MRRGSTSSTGNLGRVQTRHVGIPPVWLHRRPPFVCLFSWFRLQDINLIRQEGQATRRWHHDVSSSCFVVKQPRHVMVKKTPSIARHRGAERNRDTYSGPDKPPPWTSELGGVHRNPPRPGFRSSAGPEVGRARCLDRLRFPWLGPCPVLEGLAPTGCAIRVASRGELGSGVQNGTIVATGRVEWCWQSRPARHGWASASARASCSLGLWEAQEATRAQSGSLPVAARREYHLHRLGKR